MQNLNKNIIKFNKNSLLVYLIMFISNDTYLFGTNSDELMVSVSRYMLIVICAILLFKLNFKINIQRNRIKIFSFFFITGIYIFIAIINHEVVNRVIIKILYITVAFLLCLLLSFEEFFNAFRKAIFFISITAIVFTLLAYASPKLIERFPYIINSADVKIYTCFFAGLLENQLGSNAVRTQGIFWEPGVFQLYLNLAIVYELFYRTNINKCYLFLEFIALFLTFSTTGYIVVSWIFLTYSIVRKNALESKNKHITRFACIMFLFTISLTLFYYSEIGKIIFDKMINPESSGSTMVRKAGVITNIEIALKNPLHGIGMEKIYDEFLKVSMASKYILGFTKQNTNTLLYQFAAHGIPFGLIFTIGTYKFGNYFANGRKGVVFSIFIAIVLMYVGENLQYSSLPYIVIFFGYGWRNEIKEKLKKANSYNNKKIFYQQSNLFNKGQELEMADKII